jgi:hypothetical protein
MSSAELQKAAVKITALPENELMAGVLYLGSGRQGRRRLQVAQGSAQSMTGKSKKEVAEWVAD